MNALIINCSPVRTGATAEIVKIVEGETAHCVMSDAQVIRDIMNEFDNAEIIVSVAPSYWADIPGQFKSFIDRVTPWCNTHEPHAAIKRGKRGYAIARIQGTS